MVAKEAIFFQQIPTNDGRRGYFFQHIPAI
jgi:hypothetical protein